MTHPRTFALALAAFALLLASGCANRASRVDAERGRVEVFGVYLYERVDHSAVNGVLAVPEPCVRGYDYWFDALDLRIGYTPGGVVRLITTRNPSNSAYGVRVGDSVADATRRLLGQGFKLDSGVNVFANSSCTLTLLADERGSVFGLRLEVLSYPGDH